MVVEDVAMPGDPKLSSRGTPATSSWASIIVGRSEGGCCGSAVVVDVVVVVGHRVVVVVVLVGVIVVPRTTMKYIKTYI